MLELIGIAATGVATFFGYTRSRGFVRRRLKFVDSMRKPLVPLLAGVVAAVVAAPVVGLLPLVGGGAALVFGAGVGFGVAHGVRDTRSGRYLT